jgi:hypothetical protein
MALEQIRIGNIVYYRGKLGIAHVKVVGIESINGGEFRYTVVNADESNKSFAAYSNEIRPLELVREILSSCGFVEYTRGRFKLDGLHVGDFASIEKTGDYTQGYNDLGTYIIPPDFPTEFTLNDLEDLAISIPYLHNLQNYCEDNTIDIDFPNALKRF